MYGEGISKVGELIDLGVKLDLVQKSGSWFAMGELRLGQGRDAAKQFCGTTRTWRTIWRPRSGRMPLSCCPSRGRRRPAPPDGRWTCPPTILRDGEA